MQERKRDFIASVDASIRRYNMLNPGEKVLVAVSGGPDSVALLHALVSIRSAWSLHIAVAHLNHGLRHEDAAKDAALVERLAASLGIPSEIGFRDVQAFAKKHHLSLQEGARKVRYRFLRKVAERFGAQKIALGHQANDNAESIIMNLLRGSGTRGLTGIPPVRGNTFIRPLIDTPRSEIMAFLHEKNYLFAQDRTNLDHKYLRNWVRHGLFPLLEKRFSTDCVSSLNRLADILRSEEAYWEKVVEEACEAHVIEHGDKEIALDIQGLKALDPALSRRVVRRVVEKLAKTLKRVRHDHIGAIMNLAQSQQPSGFIYLPHLMGVFRDQNRLVFRKGEKPPLPSFEYGIASPETTGIPEIALQIRFSVWPVADVIHEVKACPSSCAFFDLDKVAFPLTVRNFRRGDRFVPLGMSGSQKVKSFFINEKVTRAKRMACPLLMSGGNIIWIGGYRISDRAKITDKTTKVLKADLLPLESG